MKKVVRCGVFETNSSATNSLIILSEADHIRWMNEDLYAVEDVWAHLWKNAVKKPEKCKLYTKEEVLEMLAENGNGYIEDECYFTVFGLTSLPFNCQGYINITSDDWAAAKPGSYTAILNIEVIVGRV